MDTNEKVEKVPTPDLNVEIEDDEPLRRLLCSSCNAPFIRGFISSILFVAIVASILPISALSLPFVVQKFGGNGNNNETSPDSCLFHIILCSVAGFIALPLFATLFTIRWKCKLCFPYIERVDDDDNSLWKEKRWRTDNILMIVLFTTSIIIWTISKVYILVFIPKTPNTTHENIKDISRWVSGLDILFSPVTWLLTTVKVFPVLRRYTVWNCVKILFLLHIVYISVTIYVSYFIRWYSELQSDYIKSIVFLLILHNIWFELTVFTPMRMIAKIVLNIVVDHEMRSVVGGNISTRYNMEENIYKTIERKIYMFITPHVFLFHGMSSLLLLYISNVTIAAVAAFIYWTANITWFVCLSPQFDRVLNYAFNRLYGTCCQGPIVITPLRRPSVGESDDIIVYNIKKQAFVIVYYYNYYSSDVSIVFIVSSITSTLVIYALSFVIAINPTLWEGILPTGDHGKDFIIFDMAKNSIVFLVQLLTVVVSVTLCSSIHNAFISESSLLMAWSRLCSFPFLCFISLCSLSMTLFYTLYSLMIA